LTEATAHVTAAAARTGGPLLAARGVSKRFGALQVLDDVTLELAPGEAVGIVGPNGAGKTTLLDLLAGATRVDSGTVALSGRDVSRLGAAARCRLGVGRTHQIPRPFTGMTVFENVLVAASMGSRLRGSAAHDQALEALAATGMGPLGNRRADALGLLDRKRLELARALATDPQVLLLDEIAGGLTEPEAIELVGQISALRVTGLTILWIEHVVHALLRVAERLVCLAGGRVIADGEPKSVMADPGVIDAYLGSSAQ
jgi:branched-chain amino acid transport system ATP-binding protein